jgi:sugar (pentulose or hexulose) kinase
VALSWLRDCLNQAHVGQPLTFEDVLALAGRAPVGSGGLVCLPFFAGERSPNLWLQVMADALGRDLSVPAWGETSALAAAFWPFLAAGGAGSINDIRNWVQFGRVQRPVPEHTAIYDRLYRTYKKLYVSVAVAFDEISGLQRELGI